MGSGTRAGGGGGGGGGGGVGMYPHNLQQQEHYLGIHD